NLLVWNVRGLNARARRNAVRQLVADQCVSLQETKLADCDDAIIRELVGTNFDFFSLPAAQTSGGILLAWNKDIWSATSPIYRDFSLSLSAHLTHVASGESWWLTVVYGPQSDQLKVQFLEELRALRQPCSGM